MVAWNIAIFRFKYFQLNLDSSQVNHSAFFMHERMYNKLL